MILDEKELTKAELLLSQKDPKMCELISKLGRCDLCERDNDYFMSLVNSIIGQQLSGKAARTIFDRVLKKFVTITPEKILDADVETLRELGLSRPKIKYIKELSLFVTTGKLDFLKLKNADSESVIHELTKVSGIGKWTAEMFLIFSLGHCDIISTADVGLQRAIKILYGQRASLEKISKKWKPYRSVASWYLWRYLDSNSQITID
jgi:DNA-3-methyladenine glycosylase II